MFWIDEQTDRQTDGQMDGQTDGWTDGRTLLQRYMNYHQHIFNILLLEHIQ